MSQYADTPAEISERVTPFGRGVGLQEKLLLRSDAHISWKPAIPRRKCSGYALVTPEPARRENATPVVEIHETGVESQSPTRPAKVE
ncbi:hypothetical protein GCM10022198_01450 [Klugiella xanthotipulae]|uniref:Uncharacterized protein n=1 Tax=Klugiella xanthotipulae TaxID=244735 RepID=A0A543I553_9MICO|nr:hypothetical protein [Klugiella xanthotipulae]TQM65718.1 hypothetical protein FB466_0530 [Klugiella xanthotipulae]